MFVQIDEDTTLNTDKIIIVRTVEDTDKYEEPHVLIDFGYSFLELDPEKHTVESITAQLIEAPGGIPYGKQQDPIR